MNCRWSFLDPPAYHSNGDNMTPSAKRRGSDMRTKGAKDVGRIIVEIEVANYGDLTLAERGLLCRRPGVAER